MKKILSVCMFLSVFVSLSLSTLAQGTIATSLSDTQIYLGESLTLTIELSDMTGGQVDIDIPGIEHFEIFSQSQGISYSSLQGNETNVFAYTLELRPRDIGSYTLGPITVMGENLTITSDDVYEVVVETPDMSVGNTQTQSEQREDITPEISSQVEEQDEIRGLRYPSVMLFIILMMGGLALIGAGVYRFVFSDTSEPETDILTQKVADLSWQETLQQYFEDLETRADTMDSETFSEAFLRGVRDIFSHESGEDIETLTLEELSELLDDFTNHPLGEVFSQSYYNLFSQRDISQKTRTDWLKTVFSYLSSI